MKLKDIASKLHLWLGLTCGAVVLVSMLAAAIFVWEHELANWYYGDYIFVEPPKAKTVLPLSHLLEKAQAYIGPGKPVHDVEVFNDPRRSYVFTVYGDCSKCEGWTYWSDYKYWDNIYVNPYTGEVIGKVDMLYNWIDLTRRVHQNLLLRYEIGHYIVGYSTLIIFVMIITGLILWFPKNKAAFKQRFTIKWNARWRRINYDIHNVGGFYTWIVIFILAVTGLVWTFEWWTNGIYRMLGDDPAQIFAEHTPPPKLARVTSTNTVDIAFTDVLTKREHWKSIYASMPTTNAENDGREIAFYMNFDENNAWDEWDNYFYDAQTGNIHHTSRYENQLLGEKWRYSNYAIHVGSIYGLPTKIIASFGALFLASLPVTGLLVYLGRKNKKDKKKIKNTSKAKHKQADFRPAIKKRVQPNTP